MTGMQELINDRSRNASQTGIAHTLPEYIDEKKKIDVEEKIAVDEISVDDLDYRDEALRLVGMERKIQFTEEQYAKVRRKLVGRSYMRSLFVSDSFFAVVGLGHPTVM